MATQLGPGCKTVPVTAGAFGLGGGGDRPLVPISPTCTGTRNCRGHQDDRSNRTFACRPAGGCYLLRRSQQLAGNSRRDCLRRSLHYRRRATFDIGFAEFKPSASADNGVFRIPVVLPMRPLHHPVISRASRFRIVWPRSGPSLCDKPSDYNSVCLRGRLPHSRAKRYAHPCPPPLSRSASIAPQS
jgi:hypothetical protein